MWVKKASFFENDVWILYKCCLRIKCRSSPKQPLFLCTCEAPVGGYKKHVQTTRQRFGEGSESLSPQKLPVSTCTKKEPLGDIRFESVLQFLPFFPHILYRPRCCDHVKVAPPFRHGERQTLNDFQHIYTTGVGNQR